MGITPSGLANRPSITSDDAQYLNGFRHLTHSRAYGQYGPLPITLTDVLSYLHLIDEENVGERLKFLRVIQNMDGVYLEHAAKKAEQSK